METKIAEITQTGLTEISLFQKGAFISKTVRVKVKKGVSEIVLDGLACDINTREFFIRPGSYSIKKISLEESSLLKAQSQRFKQEWSKLRLKNIELGDEVFLIDSEADFLNCNRNINAGGDIEKTEKFKDYYIKRLKELAAKKTRPDEELKERRKEEALLESKIEPTKTRKAVIQVFSAAEAETEITIGYYTSLMHFEPKYDVFASAKESNVLLNASALVYNKSGEDFHDCQLKVCLFDVKNAGVPAEFYPQYVNIPQPRPLYAANKLRVASFESCAEEEMDFCAPACVAPPQSSETGNGRVFLFSENKSFADGACGEELQLLSESSPASFSYECMSYADERVYLTAEFLTSVIPDDTFASVYDDDVYCGMSPLRRDELGKVVLSLGADTLISVRRQPVRCYTGKKFTGAEKKDYGFEVKLLNMKANSVVVKLTERVPVSANKAITVDAELSKGGKLNKETGRADFEIELAPRKETEISVRYSVTMPSAK